MHQTTDMITIPCRTPYMIVMRYDLKKNDNCVGKMNGIGDFLKETQLIRIFHRIAIYTY